MSFYINGTGRAEPLLSVTNNDLTRIVETSDEWISQRTGIKSRFILQNAETLSSLSTQAAQNALNDAGIAANDIDMVICATLKGDFVTPAQACVIAEKLGIHAPAFDINAACTGIIYAFSLAEGLFLTGKYNHILVVACEAMSKLVDWSDRSSCVLFGDGSAAVVLSKGNGLKATHIDCVANLKMLNLANNWNETPYAPATHLLGTLKMDGPEVYKFAVNTMVNEIEKVLAASGLSMQDIDYVLPHQANLRIIEAAKKRFKLSDDKVLLNISSHGNVSATSIGLLLDENARAGKFKKGDNLLFVAFGAGMTGGGAIIEWQK